MKKLPVIVLVWLLIFDANSWAAAPTNVGNICIPITQPSGMLSISMGGNAAANTSAITACNTSANSASKSCSLPSGSYPVNAFTWTGAAGLYGAGAGVTILTGSADTNCQITVSSSNGATFSGWTHMCPQTTRDSTHWNIFVNRLVTNFRFDSMELSGGDAGGIINFFVSNSIYTNSYIHDTLADCLYTTDGSSSIIVANEKHRNCGDDALSNVSYLGDADGIVSNILDKDNDLGFQSFARGISVVGGQNITITNNLVQNTLANAGIYLADEPSFNSRAVTNVIVSNNYLSTVSGSTGQPGILAYAGQGSPGVTNVSITNNQIVNAVHDAAGINPSGGTVVNLAFTNNTFTTPGGTGLVNQGAAGSNIFCSGNTLNGTATAPGTVCNGSNTFTPTGSSLTWSGCSIASPASLTTLTGASLNGGFVH